MRTVTYGLAFGLALVLAQAAMAGTVTFTGNLLDLHGLGFGASPAVLTLQNNAQQSGNTSEWGGVSWNGTQDVIDNPEGEVATGADKTATVTVGALKALGIFDDNFAVALNLDQEGGANQYLDVHDFYVKFYSSAGAEIGSYLYTYVESSYTATPPGTQQLPVDQGHGSGSWIFHVNQDAALTTLFQTDSNRVGITVPSPGLTNSANDGPDDFQFAQDAPHVIPLPAAAWMAFSLLGTLGLGRILRRKGA